MTKNTLFVFFLLIKLFLFSQTKANSINPINDFVVTLHEDAVNKVLSAIGEISGTNTYEVLLIKGKYHWKIQNSKINIRPDSSNFICDAFVTCGPFSYKTSVIGNVKISYDNTKNLIFIKISRAIFELYTIVFGKKVHIKDIHLEDYFKDPFAFEGPRTMTTDMEFTMPDSTKKKIYIQPTECKMEVKWKEICTACELVASDKPLKSQIKVLPPIETTKQPSNQAEPQKK